MSVITQLIILYFVALICCSAGFKKYVWFISIGYGFAITGQGIAMLIMHASCGVTALISCVTLMLYGLRLGGYLLYREHTSRSYQKHMQTEIKSGDGMSLFAKVMLWLFCGLLYLCMVSPVLFRFANDRNTPDIMYIIGTVLMVSGILLEAHSDLSKNKQKQINPHRFCDKGVFKLVRCPNYLGELILWTGTFLSGVTAMRGVLQWIIAILGYIGIVFVMFSGARRLELRQERNYGSDPQYRRYASTTPILLPFVPLYSVAKYKFLVL